MSVSVWLPDRPHPPCGAPPCPDRQVGVGASTPTLDAGAALSRNATLGNRDCPGGRCQEDIHGQPLLLRLPRIKRCSVDRENRVS
ncbi:hypothetical protein NMD1_01617 [Novosphingobium sp. MD-1]|nr:hypothetical protein NMD1_01617 [Novosphingobium sp. MD-1]